MIYLHISLFITAITISQASHIVYLENCTFSIDLYKEYLNLLWSSNDSRAINIQAVYSFPSNKSIIPGHIYTYSSQSVALIPFFVQCKSTKNISSNSYLPFTQCSSTVTNFLSKQNSESTRTNLKLKTISSMNNVPLLYIGEYYLILSNCSFRHDSTIYRLKSNEIFRFHIQYESSILTDCSSCNRRTSVCYEKTCRCRYGTIPFKLYQNKQFCIDITRNCTFDSQRCLYSKSFEHNRSDQMLLLLIILISFVLVLSLSLLWYLFRNSNQTENYSNQSISVIDKHERTPSTISTIDSIKLAIENEYPKIIGEHNNGEIVFILA
jgi:hypothetical protein